MSRTVIKLPRAESDLIGCYAYLGEEASIFYLAFDDRIELVRVLHGARDIRRVLDDTGDDD